MSKFRFEDLQPHIEMLIDALENRGASSSGYPDERVYPYAAEYRKLLVQVRNKEIVFEDINNLLDDYQSKILSVTKQNYRISKILEALKFYFIKEFNK